MRLFFDRLFSMSSVRFSLVSALTAAMVFFFSPVASIAADKFEGLPTPGLYQVDSDGRTQHLNQGSGNTTVDIKTHGASGRTEMTWTDARGKSGSKNFVGEKAQTVCVPPRAKDGSFVVPDSPGCGKSTTIKTSSGWSIKTDCSFGGFAIDIKQIDKKTWEYTVITSHKASSSMAAIETGMGGYKALLENALKNAKTPEARAQAKKALEEFAKVEPEIAKAQAEVKANKPQIQKAQAQAAAEGLIPKGDYKVKETKTVLRWTKVAESCDSAKK